MINLKEKFEAEISKLRQIISSLDKKKKEEKRKEARRTLIMVLTIFFVCVIALLVITIPVVSYEYIYQDKIFAGVYVDGINLGGLTQGEALDKLNQYVDNLKLRGLEFNYKNERFTVDMTIISPADPDLAFPILNFETEQMAQKAFAYGRTETLWLNLQKQAQSLLHQKTISLIYNLNEDEMKNSLKEKYGPSEQPSANAKIVIAADNTYQILPEKNGFVINYDVAVKELKNNLNLISINAVELETLSSQADVTKKEAEAARSLVDKILAVPKVELTYNDKVWQIENAEFKKWLAFVKDGTQAVVAFDQDLMGEKLKLIAQEVNIPPKDANITFVEGKVTQFDASANGLEVDLEQSSAKINQEVFARNIFSVGLVVKEVEPKVKTGDINDMGITEIIGVGESDFSNSSSNRIGNIKNAAKILHGILIKPGEEFSLVDAIGEVTAETGFFSEYVIKGDRTIKEYGGGLCQIATTTFRAAMYSGLPVTERKPHSYIVSYYNPIGFDAAIYGPHPDVRFINDTGHYILFQTHMEGTKLTFTFWGKSDGRKVEITKPEVYNWRSPGPAKLIENPKLAPGAKKLVEYSKRGADTHFYRYITNAKGEKTEEIWRSHYVAWPAIYEVGITPAAEGEPTNGTTPADGSAQPVVPDEIAVPAASPQQ